MLHFRKKCILESGLPRTFLDAVVFTRRLHIRYLCTDSLCVLQDDEEYSLREASNMQSIYRGSYLTLAASKSGGPDESLSSAIPEEYKLRNIPFCSDKVSEG